MTVRHSPTYRTLACNLEPSGVVAQTRPGRTKSTCSKQPCFAQQARAHGPYATNRHIISTNWTTIYSGSRLRRAKATCQQRLLGLVLWSLFPKISGTDCSQGRNGRRKEGCGKKTFYLSRPRLLPFVGMMLRQLKWAQNNSALGAGADKRTTQNEPPTAWWGFLEVDYRNLPDAVIRGVPSTVPNSDSPEQGSTERNTAWGLVQRGRRPLAVEGGHVATSSEFLRDCKCFHEGLFIRSHQQDEPSNIASCIVTSVN